MEVCFKIKELLKENLSKILEYRKNPVKKTDGSYVSEGDLYTEMLIKNLLADEYPDFKLVSEETPEINIENIKQKEVLILDPIDGTENYISGLKEWGVAVCHYKDGKHQESMLALPELNCYLSTGDKIKKYDSRICGISSSLTKSDLLNLEEGYEYRIIGCCVYNMYNVITGSFYSFQNNKGAYIWDIIPGLNIAVENGLNVTVENEQYNGELLEPNKKYRFKISQK
ncbi:inositol monophosphatase family protein [Arsenicibacter rosenii]|uniref:Inositol monophosphatase n=1 Tax=Arsenicibacter rosenii TaxID=1750698 RepID=A0A1S2VJ59_9BACT|nr:inositol monophosphatase family protein [Arsenicibacter rosenii]OIN58801.1 inositol monophosphatase [Arsenicibacter rosenii]